jgi:cytochrome c553
MQNFCAPAVFDQTITIATMNKLFAMLVLAGCAHVASAAEVVGNPQVTANKLENCIGCHGIQDYKSVFPEVYRVPKIGGQSAAYIEAALKAYRKGDRKHPSMNGIAASLTDQEITAIAAHYSQQTQPAHK